MNKILIILCLLLSSCSEQQLLSFQVTYSPDQLLNEKLKTFLPRLIKVCPGLNEYSGDFNPATLSSSQMRDYEGGVELKFQVVPNPQKLPAPLNVHSAQNTCYIDINNDGTRAYIGKAACHSICEGRLQENDANLIGREFSLK